MNQPIKNNGNRQELYLKERELFTNSLTQGSLSFDKTILTLSAGAFAISITFIKDIVPTTGNAKWLLFTAWAMFGLSILITLASFLSSQHNCLKKIEIIDKAFNNNESSNHPNKVDTLTLHLNMASYIIFAVGLGFIIWFSAFNYSSIKEHSNGDQENCGYSDPQSNNKSNLK
ncbi:MAG: hypothetical protein PHD29_05925 [bacterium]|nr:hypothetical protein [bacterium]